MLYLFEQFCFFSFLLTCLTGNGKACILFVYKNPWIPWYETRTLREHLSVYLLHYLSSLIFPQPSIPFSLLSPHRRTQYPSFYWIIPKPNLKDCVFFASVEFSFIWTNHLFLPRMRDRRKKGEDEIKLAVKRCKKLQNNIC